MKRLLFFLVFAIILVIGAFAQANVSSTSQTTEIPAVPQLGQPTLLQQALNRLPAIPIAGNNLNFVFGGETWIARRNGRDFFAGTFSFEETDEDSVILTLRQTHIYPPRNIPGINWVRTPGPTIVLEYKMGPPPSLSFLSSSSSQEENNTTGSASARSNWISGELYFIGTGVRYERMLGSKLSLGANIYFSSSQIALNAGADANLRFYPWSNIFFLGVAGGYHIHYSWQALGYMFGAAISPEIGWKFFNVNTSGGLFFQVGIKVPIIFGEYQRYTWDGWVRRTVSEFGVDVGIVPFIGLGHAW